MVIRINMILSGKMHCVSQKRQNSEEERQRRDPSSRTDMQLVLRIGQHGLVTENQLNIFLMNCKHIWRIWIWEDRKQLPGASSKITVVLKQDDKTVTGQWPLWPKVAITLHKMFMKKPLDLWHAKSSVTVSQLQLSHKINGVIKAAE